MLYLRRVAIFTFAKRKRVPYISLKPVRIIDVRSFVSILRHGYFQNVKSQITFEITIFRVSLLCVWGGRVACCTRLAALLPWICWIVLNMVKYFVQHFWLSQVLLTRSFNMLTTIQYLATRCAQQCCNVSSSNVACIWPAAPNNVAINVLCICMDALSVVNVFDGRHCALINAVESKGNETDWIALWRIIRRDLNGPQYRRISVVTALVIELNCVL